MAKAAAQRMRRADFQELAQLRIVEAEQLLKLQSFPGAYYLTGVAVECALKACLARTTQEFEFPDLERARDSWHHDLTRLLNAAGLSSEHDKRTAVDAEFKANWLIVKDWDVASRYQKRAQPDAQSLFDAATERVHGVLPWIGEHW